MKYADAIARMTELIKYLEDITTIQKMNGQMLGAQQSGTMMGSAIEVRGYIIENIPGARDGT